MNKDLNTIMEIKKNKMMEVYRKHHMELMFMDNVEQLHEYLKTILADRKVLLGVIKAGHAILIE